MAMDPLSIILSGEGHGLEVGLSNDEPLQAAEAEGTSCVSPSQAVAEPPTLPHWSPPHAVAAFESVMTPAMKVRLRAKPVCWRFGGDCSGAEAPVHAFRAVRGVLSTFDIDFCIDHRFSSEDPRPAGDAARAFLLLNSQPAILFDGVGRVDGKGFCRINRQSMIQGAVDFYAAGWVCKDRSRVNCHRKAVDEDLTADSGASSTTLHASIAYIEMEQPAIVKLEHIHDKKSISIAARLLRGVRGGAYLVKCFCLNSRAAKLATSRTRIFIIGVHSAKVLVHEPMHSWDNMLALVFSAMPQVTFDSILACDESREVQAMLEQMTRPRRVRKRTAVEDSKHNRTIRENFLKQFNVFIPPLPELLASPLASGQCVHSMPEREQELFLMHKFVASEVVGFDVEKRHMLWDLQYSSKWAKYRKHADAEGLLGCITTGSRIVDTHADVNRYLSGYELMLAQGFPPSILVDGLTNSDVTTMAGNTISVPVITGFIAMLLRCITVLDEPLSADDALRQFKDYKAGLIDGELEQGIWVGSATYDSDTTTPFDSLPWDGQADAKAKSKLQAAVASNARDAVAAVVSRKPSAKVDSKVGRSRVCKRPSHSLQKRPAVFQRPAALKQP